MTATLDTLADVIGARAMTPDELDAATAMFETRAEAQAAADAAMPRRKHDRPYPVRYGRASALAGADRWIVWVGNAVLMRDGTMYDHQRGRVIGR
jgi:hypothetical protein